MTGDPLSPGESAGADWRAERYDALPLPHVRWGRRVVAGLSLRGDETVLDAGAGTGRDTQLLLVGLPRGRVVALDASPAMLARLRRRLGPEPRVLAVRADLARPLPLRAASCDAVMSVAALHWLPDHDRIWRRLARVLRPGGHLRVECGGAGNVARVLATAARLYGPDVVRRPTFSDAEATRSRLVAAGFADVRVSLRRDAAVLSDQSTFVGYLSTIVLRDLPEERVREVADQLPERTIDYVRLEVDAVRR